MKNRLSKTTPTAIKVIANIANLCLSDPRFTSIAAMTNGSCGLMDSRNNCAAAEALGDAYFAVTSDVFTIRIGELVRYFITINDIQSALMAGNAASRLRIDLVTFYLFMRFAMRLSKLVAIAAIPVWLAGHARPAAAQSFDDRWSIIPKAHAEPAPPPPEASPQTKQVVPAPPATATENATRETTRDRSNNRSSKRVFSGKASFYSYSSGKTASGETFDRNRLTAAHRGLPSRHRAGIRQISRCSNNGSRASPSQSRA